MDFNSGGLNVYEIMRRFMDPKTAEMFVTLGSGSAIGTLWKIILMPKLSPLKYFLEVFLSLTVGMVIGSGVVHYFNITTFGPMMAVPAVLALLSRDVLTFFQRRGESLQKGQIDLSAGGGKSDVDE